MVIPVRQRIEQVITFLIKKGKVKNPTDFAKKMPFDTGSLSKIRGGEREVPVELLQKIHDTYNIARNFLFEGKGDIENKKIEIDEELYYKLLAENTAMKESIEAMKVTINAQEITIAGLRNSTAPKVTYTSKKQTVKKSK